LKEDLRVVGADSHNRLVIDPKPCGSTNHLKSSQ
jgi:hypothetical protein